MSKNCFFAIIVFLLPFLAWEATAQNFKTGVVDREYIQKALTKASVEQLNLEQSKQQLYASIEKANKEIGAKREAVAKANKPDPTPDIAAIDSEVRVVYGKIKGQQRDLEKRQTEHLQALHQQVKTAIQQVAQEQSYSVILELHQAPYYSAASDITSLVLAKLGLK